MFRTVEGPHHLEMPKALFYRHHPEGHSTQVGTLTQIQPVRPIFPKTRHGLVHPPPPSLAKYHFLRRVTGFPNHLRKQRRRVREPNLSSLPENCFLSPHTIQSATIHPEYPTPADLSEQSMNKKKTHFEHSFSSNLLLDMKNCCLKNQVPLFLRPCQRSHRLCH